MKMKNEIVYTLVTKWDVLNRKNREVALKISFTSDVTV